MTTDLYAITPPKERINLVDPLRRRVSAKKVTLTTIGIAFPGLMLGMYELSIKKEIPAIFVGFIILPMVSFLLAHSVLFGFTHYLGRGIILRRSEPLRYWLGIGLLCGMYLFICCFFIGINKSMQNKTVHRTIHRAVLSRKAQFS